jgi:hypothetical protein
MGRDSGHISDVENELIAVCGEHGNGKPHGLALLVERSPPYLEDSDAAILRQVEENCFCRIGGSDRDPVAISDLLKV